MARGEPMPGLLDMMQAGVGAEQLGTLAQLRRVGAADPDALPDTAAPAHPVVCRGDTWLLGRHRLTCGDSTVAADVVRALGVARPHLMVTDPPYGVAYDATWRNEAGQSINGKTVCIASGKAVKSYAARAVGRVHNDDRADWREAWALFSGDVVYVWHAGINSHVVHASLASCEFEARSHIIWVKNNLVISRGNYHSQHEPCWYAVRKGCTGHWTGDHSQTTTWFIDKPMRSETGHSTQKPVECMLRPMLNNSAEGDWVYEPFCGSGTSLIAAEMSGRCCAAIEIDPLYVYISILRWQEYSGGTATLESTGEAFGEVLRRRLANPEADIQVSSTAVNTAAQLTSITSDPCLIEWIYSRYCPRGGSVIDPYPVPFREEIARKMGRRYREAPGDMLLLAPEMTDDGSPLWYAGWLGGYLEKVKPSLADLVNDRYAVVVAEDVRIGGYLVGWPYHATEALAEAGARLCDEHTVVTATGQARIAVCCVGDPREAAKACRS